MLIPVETGQNYTILQESSNISKTTLNRLSVQISLFGLSFLITNTSTDEVLFFKEEQLDRPHTPEELQLVLDRILKEHHRFKGPFKEVVLVFSTSICTVVPATLFDETKAIEYLKFNSKILASDFVAYDEVSEQDMVVVYIPFVNITNVFFERFGEFKYYHATTLLLENVLSKHPLNATPEVFIHVQGDFVTTMVTLNGRLQLCNTFAYKTPEDFIYYILFCFEQLKLNPDSVSVTVSGNISKDDALYDILYTYVRNVDFDQTTKVGPFKNNEELPHHHFVLKNIG